MVWNYSIYAFVFVFFLTSILSLFDINKKIIEGKTIESYLLANGQLGKFSVVNLLLSSSFGINALFYAVWLGYTVGAWALIIQVAWGASFYLLSKYTDILKTNKSLHEFLGNNYGKATRIIAGLCSLIGIMYMMGWEVGVGTSALDGLLNINNENQNSSINSLLLTVFVVIGCLFYTVLGGLRGNAKADKILNLIKLTTIGLLTLFIAITFINKNESAIIFKSYFPSINVMITNLGFWGLLTNVVFNLAWQFVDNSSWQSIIAGTKVENEDTASNLRTSGLVTFFIPGVIGAILGGSLFGVEGITPENIFFKAIETLKYYLPEYSTFIILSAFLSVFASIMSMIDGLFLASTYTFIIDILHPNKTIDELDQDDKKANKILLQTRVILIFIAIFSTLIVRIILDKTGLNLFEFVYIVIISQLSLTGPVITALFKRKPKNVPLWTAILIALSVGFGCIIWGTFSNSKFLTDGAGTFSLLTSVIISFYITKK